MRGKKVAVLLGIVLLLAALGCSRSGDKIGSCPPDIREGVSEFRADIAPLLEKYVRHEQLDVVERVDLESQLRSSWRVYRCQLHVDCSSKDDVPERMDTEIGQKLVASNPVCAEGLRDLFRNISVKLDVLKFRNLHQDEKATPSAMPANQKVKKNIPVGNKASK